VLSHMDTFTIVQDIPDEVVTRALQLWDDKVSTLPKSVPVLRIRIHLRRIRIQHLG
jgi:hypothetical protein